MVEDSNGGGSDYLKEKEKENNNCDQFYQVVLLGNYGVGKSSIFKRFESGEFVEDIDDRGLDKTEKVFKKANKSIKLQLWDTAGLERAGDMTSGYFRYANAVILTYDCTDKESLFSLKQRWADNCADYCNPNIRYFMVGTKIDAPCVEVDDDFPRRCGFEIKVEQYMRISTKTGQNFDDFIDTVLERLMDGGVRNAPHEGTTELKDFYDETDGKSKSKSSCC